MYIIGVIYARFNRREEREREKTMYMTHSITTVDIIYLVTMKKTK